MTRTKLMRGRLLPLVGLAIVAGLLAVGCSQGSYPLDIFYEMHYQPSYKAHEPPRLTPPESAVPWYGSTPPQPTSFGGSGKHIFETNCAMCHGATGQGDGQVLGRMVVDYGYITTDAPLLNPNLTSEAAKSLDRDRSAQRGDRRRQRDAPLCQTADRGPDRTGAGLRRGLHPGRNQAACQ